jgi:uncharacterized protein with GYD domain
VIVMPRYLVQASYTREGSQGLLEEGGTGRKDAVQKVVADLDGEVEALYYAYGEDDIIVIVNFPNHLSMAAIAMTVKATGTLHTKATVLLTPEEIDEATRMPVGFRPPGG